MTDENAAPEPEQKFQHDFEVLLLRYVKILRAELDERWKNWKLDMSDIAAHEVIGALLARHVSIATNLARSPGIWNVHIAPILLRTLSDAYISLAWILKNPTERSQQFIRYGLGRFKLAIEWDEKAIRDAGKNPDSNEGLRLKKQWLDSQRYSWLTEVNVGSWTGGDTRKMASDAGCDTAYDYSYVPNSAATHNMWDHVVFHNLAECKSALHRYHRIPVDRDEAPDVRYLRTAAAIVDQAFKLFDTKCQVKCQAKSAYDALLSDLDELTAENSPS